MKKKITPAVTDVASDAEQPSPVEIAASIEQPLPDEERVETPTEEPVEEPIEEPIEVSNEQLIEAPSVEPIAPVEQQDAFSTADPPAALDSIEDGFDDWFAEPVRSPDLDNPTQMDAPPGQTSRGTDNTWYLGLDIGTTGISAVLMNQLTYQLHPISWSIQPPGEDTFAIDGLLRLPTLVYLSTDDGYGETADLTTAPLSSERLAIVPVAPVSTATASGLMLRNLKPYLKTGIPHYSPQTSRWEPVLQWSDQHQVPLSWIHQALRSLLSALGYQPLSAAQPSSLTCTAVGLDTKAFQTALRQLAGVVVGYPANWSDTYTFNVREAILAAKLVAHPEQICFVEDTIATLLSGLRSADGRDIVLPFDQAQELDWHNANWQGGTLILNGGATVTELSLVDLPEQLSDLHYRDFTIRNLFYGGNAIDQDIVCQLFYPAWSNLRTSFDASGQSSVYTVNAEGAAKSDQWNWQGDSPVPERSEPSALEALGLDQLTLPTPGDPDPANRAALQQRLESSALGRSLLEAARHLKLTLQRRDRFTLKLGDQQWVVTRPELGSRVFLPYIQRLNRELNALLSQTGISVLSINQVICTGGTASLSAIARWLRQKLPNATILQDTYTGVRAPSPQENCLPLCSRVAYGLAALPLHPQVLNLPRQQYSDYFLLLEMLRTFPDQPVSAKDVMQLLERRGINTQACQLRILALLEGHLPPGLVPTERESTLFTAESNLNPDYQTLLAAPLFIKAENQTYRPNYTQWNHLRRYLDTLMASAHQKLTEPLTVNAIF